ncbi:hypothetical protein NEMIN01_0170 [Nematocida minor]|uniref:uncharacterized protein n=1 Tax=Nematocida minor TaxID=1912983 RepID=UPI002220E5F8|nr:uncharacterized protein NEMIN01_0066 [Nematocida minor]XP_051332072.1 uncharacterized protein NEMIN01_0170 [Nematocida minor]KAI5188802.1 hypothetical protein NEMIN01_0066 [Nematocida minor]KAI5188906.1 hypothetical protein NEMIN01_0170 [Nematocida minor]
MAPREEKKKSPSCSEISQIFMEGETLLKGSSLIDKEEPIQEFASVPDNGLDQSFGIENKSYHFLSDNESFYGDLKKGPFHSKAPINKEFTDNILFKEMKFSSPPRRGGKYRKAFGAPQLMDPDDSLDIETGTFQRKRKFTEKAIKETESENMYLFKEELGAHTANSSFTKLPGFKTAEGSSVYVNEECTAKARRSFDFLQSSTISQISPPKPKVIYPREKEIQDALQMYRKVKQEIFPLTRSDEEEYDMFSLFKWAWISLLPQIQEIQKRGGELQNSEIERLVLLESKKRWKLNPKSVLQRIAEHDESPAVYMKVLVVEGGTDVITITDGIYSLRAKLDEGLQCISSKITVGKILQVACSVLLQGYPMSIWQANAERVPVIELKYNGVKPCLSGPLGYQNAMGYIRALSSIRLQGGFISCLMLKVDRHIDTAYIVNIKGSKTVIEEDRIESTVQRIEKSIESLGLSTEEKMKEFDSVKLHKYKRYEVSCDYSPGGSSAILSLWESALNDNNLGIGKRYLFFMLTTPAKKKESDRILLSTTSRTSFKLI